MTYDGNPVEFFLRHIEIVTREKDGSYLAVYECGHTGVWVLWPSSARVNCSQCVMEFVDEEKKRQEVIEGFERSRK